MTERERLIEVIGKSFAEEYEKRNVITAEYTADYLLANGVKMGFFKVGKKVYFHQFDNNCKKVVVEGEIIKTSKKATECIVALKDGRNLWFSCNFLGTTIFFNKEEAEAELKE